MQSPTARQLNELFDSMSIFGFKSNGIIPFVGMGFRWELVLRVRAIRPACQLILTFGELLHRKGAIVFCCGFVPSAFKFRCLGSQSSGINYLWFRNGLYQFLTRKA